MRKTRYTAAKRTLVIIPLYEKKRLLFPALVKVYWKLNDTSAIA
jgi:hypothetical protein